MWLRRRSPIFNALSLTTVGALFLVAGATGYSLDRHARFVAGTAWSPTAIWWQVAIGVALLAAAVWFWRRGLRQLRRG
jgi:membrane protein implicated in regulation of membrane protease activity